MFKILFTLCAVAFALGCGNSSPTDGDSDPHGSSTPTPPTTLVTTTDLTDGSLVTWYGGCETFTGWGATMDAMSYSISQTFHKDGGFDYQVQIFNDTTCGLGGGTHVWTYDMFGTYALGEAATLAGATQISYTRTSELITMYSSQWAAYLDNGCHGGATPAFNPVTGAVSSQDPVNFVCSNSGGPTFTFPNFPMGDSTTDNVVTLNGGTTKTITVSATSNLWFPGNTSSPTSASLVLTHQ